MSRLTEIVVRGAREHNLRGVDVRVPHGTFTVISGVSGSGKTSLARDTIHAEGRRRYLESLSAFARQFVERVPRPDVEEIAGLPPTVAIDQRTTRGGARATVASMSDVLDYLRLLWARLGTRHCERCGEPVTATSRERIRKEVARLGGRKKRVHLLAPMVRRRKGFHTDVFRRLARLGIERVRVDGEGQEVDATTRLSRYHEHSIEAVVATARTTTAHRDELDAGIERALDIGKGTLLAAAADDLADAVLFSAVSACAECGIAYRSLEPGDLSWSLKRGQCGRCRGRGTEETDGDGEPAPCKRCDGARLGKASRGVRYHGLGLHEFLAHTITDARAWLLAIDPASERESVVLTPVRDEVAARLAFVADVGLSYLSLDRGARTLSGGESQRVRLASQLGTGLRGVCYVLDEPTIGLHPVDTTRLLGTLTSLADGGATLLVVEHDEDTIRAADLVIDLGPGAGVHGGRIAAVGSPADLARRRAGVTGEWLARAAEKSEPRKCRDTSGPAIRLKDVTARNLRGIDVAFPVGALTCVTGVSGSGKSTLVRHVLLPVLLRKLDRKGPAPGAHRSSSVPPDVQAVVEVDQSPIGKTSRSVPATYTKLMDPLRKLFAETIEARARGFTASRFSFNSGPGRCPECQGRGAIKMEMSFLPDVRVECDQCGGARYDEETLAVTIAGHSIAEALDMPIAQARPIFSAFPKIARVLDVLDDVGLGYLRLGQPSPTLSGGEAQRVKLATEMARRRKGGRVYLLDEPTTGLHAQDVDRLIAVLHDLVELGNTVVVIEHQMDVIAAADHVIDLGPGGGAAGGGLVASGTPEQVARVKRSATGRCLAARV